MQNLPILQPQPNPGAMAHERPPQPNQIKSAEAQSLVKICVKCTAATSVHRRCDLQNLSKPNRIERERKKENQRRMFTVQWPLRSQPLLPVEYSFLYFLFVCCLYQKFKKQIYWQEGYFVPFAAACDKIVADWLSAFLPPLKKSGPMKTRFIWRWNKKIAPVHRNIIEAWWNAKNIS